MTAAIDPPVRGAATRAHQRPRLEGGPPRPRPHQTTALEAVRAGATASHGRMQVWMACGTGKTYVGRWHAQAISAQLTVVLLPSLALVAQTMNEWRRASGWPFEALVVCSDPSTSAGAAERGEAPDQADAPWWARARAAVTTSAWKVAEFLSRATPGRPRVVFSTYHSAPVVAAAQEHANTHLDLVVCDEAHHLAGRPRAEFRAAQRLRAAATLFLTATPVITGEGSAASMRSERLFGPVAYSYPTGQAVADGWLVDWELLVLQERPVLERDTALGGHGAADRRAADLAATVLGAVHQRRLRSLITYHGRNTKAAAFAAMMDGARLPDGRRVRARHVSGATPAAQRLQALAWLGEETSGEVRVIANARCLVEGVDVPGVDGVVFADPRTSTRDIIQAVGRALRPAPGKSVGTIIVPVAVPADTDAGSELLASRFAHVWNTVRAMRAHDGRFAADLDAVETDAVTGRWPSTSKSARRLAERIVLDVPAIDPAQVYLRVVTESTSTWAYYLQQVNEWAQEHPGRLLALNARWRGKRIGRWGEQQRRAYRKGLLSDAQVAALEAVPEWVWDLPGQTWQRSYEALTELAGRLPHGLNQDPAAPSIYTGLTDANGRPLGWFGAEQRQLYRDQMLPAAWAAALERLPGWSWDAGLPADDIAMVQALRCHAEFEKHVDVPENHVDDDGLELGRWVVAVRRRRFTRRLHPTLEEEIQAASPPGRDRGSPFGWRVAETKWRLHYSALRQYARREGAATPPALHHERLPDVVVEVGAWTDEQQDKHARGRLEAQYARWLEALPGWRWRSARSTSGPGAGGPEASADGPARQARKVPEHGTYTRYVHGPGRDGEDGIPCRCDDCRAANARMAEAAAERRRTGEQVLVDASPVRDHLENLAAAGLGYKRVSELAGVSTSAVGKILYGDRRRGMRPSKRVRRATAEKILAVQPTEKLLADRAVIDGSGTRRRLRALVAAGWSQARIADRLGMLPSNFGRVLNTTDPVRLGTARAANRLYDELKNRQPDEDEWRAKIAANRARGYARSRGWLPPSAWDDAQLDLSEAELRRQLAKQVAAMDDGTLRQCYELSRDPAVVLDPVAAAAAAAWVNATAGRRARSPHPEPSST